MKNEIKKIRNIWHCDILSMSGMVISMFSFIQNEVLKRQGIEWNEFEPYLFFREVHSLLKMHSIVDQDVSICRVGGDEDGGYIMARPYSREFIAYSFGIGKNVSWDKQMAEAGYQVYQYDHTIRKLPQTHPNFHWKKVGITAGKDTKNLYTFRNLLRQNGHEKEKGMVLKMDIEGCEWEIFNEIDTQILNRFDQIVIELHRVSNLKKKKYILKALRKITNSFAVIHIHGCNYSSVNYCNNFITPDTLEVTFVNCNRFNVIPDGRLLPCNLDRPDNPNVPDIWLGKWNDIE